jgi:hypothetical protein
MSLVYEIFDKYMAEKDRLFLFYMVVALISLNEDVRGNYTILSLENYEFD